MLLSDSDEACIKTKQTDSISFPLSVFVSMSLSILSVILPFNREILAHTKKASMAWKSVTDRGLRIAWPLIGCSAAQKYTHTHMHASFFGEVTFFLQILSVVTWVDNRTWTGQETQMAHRLSPALSIWSEGVGGFLLGVGGCAVLQGPNSQISSNNNSDPGP